MRPILLLACAGTLLAPTSGFGSPVKSVETVQYKSGDETVSGYLALPDSAVRHPALVVIHEWWGLNDWVKEQARKFADQGSPMNSCEACPRTGRCAT
jgi:carboxymethylenebutenolidase